MIDILMATYNGEKYIEEQINSILNQTTSDWKLYIRDDGSSDNTVDIIEKFVQRYPDKIFFIKDNKKGLGAKLNFGELIKMSSSDYCMFCDQDDVWINDKIEKTLREMNNMESKYGKNTPILIHTDLLVVNENLEIIDNSFFKYQGINPNRNSLNNLLFSNTVTGCTMMLNKELTKLIKIIPEESMMHDWWIALVAAYLGKIYTINEPTIMYRQHSNNTLGAVKKNKTISIKRFIRNKKEHKIFTKNIIKQSLIINKLFGQSIGNQNSKVIKALIELENKSFLGKRISLIKNNLLKGSIKQNILLLIYI